MMFTITSGISNGLHGNSQDFYIGPAIISAETGDVYALGEAASLWPLLRLS